MTPGKLLDVAKSLRQWAGSLGDDVPLEEAALRSVVNRAYYGAFLHAREYLRTRDGDPNLYTKAKAVHAAVIGVLGAARATADEKEAGEALSRMRDRRVKADDFLKFKKSRPRWSGEADDQLSDATTVFTELP